MQLIKFVMIWLTIDLCSETIKFNRKTPFTPFIWIAVYIWTYVKSYHCDKYDYFHNYDMFSSLDRILS